MNDILKFKILILVFFPVQWVKLNKSLLVINSLKNIVSNTSIKIEWYKSFATWKASIPKHGTYETSNSITIF